MVLSVSSLFVASVLSLANADPFTALVLANFDTWDKDHNGVLSADEIDDLTVDPAIKGDRAAAIAAMKLAMRSTKSEPPTITRSLLGEASKNPGPSPDDALDDTEDESKKLGLNDRFARARRKISTASHTLFATGKPQMEPCHQGPLGDCYFVSVAGAMALQRPDDLKALFTEDRDKVRVTFPGKQPVEIVGLTDAEFAISSTAGKNGMWLPVLEHALGASRQRSKPGGPDEPTDLIARGGSAGASIELLTGHAADRINLGAAALGKLSEPQRKQRLADLREQIATAVEHKRLAAAGTNKEDKLPPGVTPNHAFAVIGFDKSADTVELWNPHGNTFRPRGAPGLATGYTTRGGRFTMPVEEFALVFRGFSYETDRKAGPGRPASPVNRKKN